MFRHDNFFGRLEFFVASFSRARNDLGQWRTYADNGRGFAIGFAPAVFTIGELKPHLLPEFVGPVRYEIAEVRARHMAALEQAAAIFLDAVNVNADLVRDKSVGIPFMQEFAREIIAQPLNWNCLTSKHASVKASASANIPGAKVDAGADAKIEDEQTGSGLQVRARGPVANHGNA